MTVESLDLAQQFQTPVFVATDLDLGMNLWLTEPLHLPGKADPAGQGSHRGRPRAAGPLRAVQGHRRRRRLLPDHSRHRASAGGLLHPRHRPQREVRLQRTARRLEEEPRPPGPQARDGPADHSPSGHRGRPRRPASA